jgi:hypothetical protein
MPVAAEAGRNVPMAGFPVSEMAAEMMAVPVVKVVMRKVMPMVETMAIMGKPMSAEGMKATVVKDVAETAVRAAAAAARHGGGLSKDGDGQTGRNDGRASREHQRQTSNRRPAALSAFRRTNSTAFAIK